MTKKFFLLIVSAVVIILTSVVFINSSRSIPNTPNVPSPTQAINEVNLTIDFGNEQKQTFRKAVTQGSTAFSILKETAEENGIALETQQYDFGIFVKSVDGKESSSKMAWIYFVNGQSGQTAADKYEVKDGDVVEWKYMKPE